MEDKELENIINKTLDERKKRTVAKIFHDPVKADAAFTIMTCIAIIAIVVLVMMITSPHGVFLNKDNFSEKILPYLNCQQLKDLYEEDLNYIESSKIQKFLFIKCL